jgi:hypothetical protein
MLGFVRTKIYHPIHFWQGKIARVGAAGVRSPYHCYTGDPARWPQALEGSKGIELKRFGSLCSQSLEPNLELGLITCRGIFDGPKPEAHLPSPAQLVRRAAAPR